MELDQAVLEVMTKEQLIQEIEKLRNGIRKHRDATGHDLCWYHPELWALLPEGQIKGPFLTRSEVPNWCEFMQHCAAYRKSLGE